METIKFDLQIIVIRHHTSGYWGRPLDYWFNFFRPNFLVHRTLEISGEVWGRPLHLKFSSVLWSGDAAKVEDRRAGCDASHYRSWY